MFHKLKFILFLYIFKEMIFALTLFCEINISQNVVQPDTIQTDNNNLYYAIAATSAYYGLSVYVLQNTWYKDKKVVPFHFYDDTGGYLQVDKFGHTFGSYFYSYLGYKGLKRLGLNKNEALLIGGSMGFLMQAPIEIMDGIHEGYGFSWGDIIANTCGSVLVIGQELLFNDQIVKYKFTYWESKYSKISNGYLGTNSFNRILKDYNGHTYWLSFPVNKIITNGKLPDWFNLAIGYGAGGMFGEFDNITEYNGVQIPPTDRYRRIMLSLDCDWTRIETDSQILKTILDGLTFIKMPFPAVEFNTKGEIKFHLIYY